MLEKLMPLRGMGNAVAGAAGTADAVEGDAVDLGANGSAAGARAVGVEAVGDEPAVSVPQFRNGLSSAAPPLMRWPCAMVIQPNTTTVPNTPSRIRRTLMAMSHAPTRGLL